MPIGKACRLRATRSWRFHRQSYDDAAQRGFLGDARCVALQERAILVPGLNTSMRGDVARHMVTKTVRFPDSYSVLIKRRSAARSCAVALGGSTNSSRAPAISM